MRYCIEVNLKPTRKESLQESGSSHLIRFADYSESVSVQSCIFNSSLMKLKDRKTKSIKIGVNYFLYKYSKPT